MQFKPVAYADGMSEDEASSYPEQAEEEFGWWDRHGDSSLPFFLDLVWVVYRVYYILEKR